MSDAAVQHFESQLELLEAASRRGDSLKQLLTIAQSALSRLVNKCDVVLVVVEAKQLRLLVGTPNESLCELCGDKSRLVSSASELQTEKHSSTETWSIAASRPLSVDHRFDCYFLVDLDPVRDSLLNDACRTVSDLLAEATARLLLSDLNQRLHQYGSLSAFVHNLARTRTVDEWAQEIAQRGVRHLGQGRVSVFARNLKQWETLAVTGIVNINRSADAVHRNERLQEILAEESLSSTWIDSMLLRDEFDGELRTLLAQYAALGIHYVRSESVSGNDGSVTHGLLLEVFDRQAVPPESQVLLARQELADSFRLLPRKGESSAWRLPASPFVRTLLLSLVTIFILTLIPANFEIEVSGQAFPRERRRVFAPDDGIVEELLVSADERVKAMQPLLRLRNPERELELNRVLGEIESAVSRLQAIRTTRTSASPGSASNPPARSADLSSEEQQLEKKLATLREEQLLIEQQITSLTITAPVDGVVYQSRLQEQLRSRPVSRGQQLLEVVNDAGEWQLELQVPDNVVGYIRDAGESRGENATRVQFTLNDNSRNVHDSTLQSLDLASHLAEGELQCQATALVSKDLSQSLRPGQSVTARIECGKKSLAFVLFREVIEFWQKKRFAWF